METVIVLPVAILIFSFIWQFTMKARDQLSLAEHGLDAARLVAYKDSQRRKDLTAASVIMSAIDKPGRKAEREPMTLMETNSVRILPNGGSSRAIASNPTDAPWTMFVAGQWQYSDTGNYARQRTYMLARTAASYVTGNSGYVRHRALQATSNPLCPKMGIAETYWLSRQSKHKYNTTRTDRLWIDLPDPGSIRSKNWKMLGDLSGADFAQDDSCLGSTGCGMTIMGSRDTRLLALSADK